MVLFPGFNHLIRRCRVIVLVIALSISGVPLGSTVRAAPAPVVEGSFSGTVSPQQLEQRLKRIETRLENQGLDDLLIRVDRMQQEIQKLSGKVEELGYTLDAMKKSQRDLYQDIDNRMRRLEQAGGPGSQTLGSTPGQVPVTPLGAPSPSAGETTASTGQPAGVAVADPNMQLDEQVARTAYERAFNLLKQGRYDLAIESFRAFLETYPSASYADNAQYWLGEANYVQKHYKEALEEFKKVVEKYPKSPKKADALLKIGYTQANLGDNKTALDTLNSVVSQYPDSTAARLAQKRVAELKSGH